MFVSFEGPEGAGKSTVIRAIDNRLRSNGRATFLTREPGSGPFGQKIREILLEGEDMEPRAELFLFLADRAQHVARLIRPALEAGKIVLCDRYVDSTFVYQSIGRRLDAGFVVSANAFATQGLIPARTVLLDIAPEIGLSRQTSKDRLDLQPLEFHRSVREGFLRLAVAEPTRWIVIDADRPLEEVVNQVWAELAFLH